MLLPGAGRDDEFAVGAHFEHHTDADLIPLHPDEAARAHLKRHQALAASGSPNGK